MCELLGMSANVPTDICFSFAGLMQRGGATGPHRDGWGIAFYEGGRGCRTFHDPQASVESEVARLVRDCAIKSRIVVSHIRKATHGRVCLENTHPFTRELWGRTWAFAHNGKVKGARSLPLGFYRPVGGTDSERAFCWMLGRIRERYPEPPRGAGGLRSLLRDLCGQLRAMGSFNMLLSDSQALYAYCSTNLAWVTRRAPFGEVKLSDQDMSVDFSALTGPTDVVSLIATRPLTRNEDWTVLRAGAFVVFKDGVAEVE